MTATEDQIKLLKSLLEDIEKGKLKFLSIEVTPIWAHSMGGESVQTSETVEVNFSVKR